MAAAIRLRVVTPAEVVFEGEAQSVVATAWDGRIGILLGHAPLLTLLGDGLLDVDPGRSTGRSFNLAGGVMKVEANEIMVLADSVPDPVPRASPPRHSRPARPPCASTSTCTAPPPTARTHQRMSWSAPSPGDLT